MSVPDKRDIICPELCLQFAPQTTNSEYVSPPNSPAAPPSSPQLLGRSISESDSDSDDTADYIVYPSPKDPHVFSNMAEFADILEHMPCAILRKSMQIINDMPTLDSIAECE